VGHEFDRLRIPSHAAAPALAKLVVILNLPDPRRARAVGLLASQLDDIEIVLVPKLDRSVRSSRSRVS
jgi:hypothetical protein